MDFNIILKKNKNYIDTYDIYEGEIKLGFVEINQIDINYSYFYFEKNMGISKIELQNILNIFNNKNYKYRYAKKIKVKK